MSAGVIMIGAMAVLLASLLLVRLRFPAVSLDRALALAGFSSVHGSQTRYQRGPTELTVGREGSRVDFRLLVALDEPLPEGVEVAYRPRGGGAKTSVANLESSMAALDSGRCVARAYGVDLSGQTRELLRTFFGPTYDLIAPILAGQRITLDSMRIARSSADLAGSFHLNVVDRRIDEVRDEQGLVQVDDPSIEFANALGTLTGQLQKVRFVHDEPGGFWLAMVREAAPESLVRPVALSALRALPDDDEFRREAVQTVLTGGRSLIAASAVVDLVRAFGPQPLLDLEPTAFRSVLAAIHAERPSSVAELARFGLPVQYVLDDALSTDIRLRLFEGHAVEGGTELDAILPRLAAQVPPLEILRIARQHRYVGAADYFAERSCADPKSVSARESNERVALYQACARAAEDGITPLWERALVAHVEDGNSAAAVALRVVGTSRSLPALTRYLTAETGPASTLKHARLAKEIILEREGSASDAGMLTLAAGDEGDLSIVNDGND